MLKLNGKPFTPQPDYARAIKQYLDKAEGDDLFLTEKLAADLDIPIGHITAVSGHIPKIYRHWVRKTCYWGNPKAIEELRRQVGA